MLLCVDWSKFKIGSQSLPIKKKKVSSNNLETNKLFEKRAELESTQLLQDDSEYKHRVQRPEGFETLCRSDPSCPEDCDACCQLPYHNKTGAASFTILPGSTNGIPAISLEFLDTFLNFGIL